MPSLSDRALTLMPNKHHLGQQRSDRRFLLTSGVALHHVSAKDGTMSRPVWEDGTSWAGNELCGEVG